MRVAFAGTPEFAARALKALLAAGFDVPLVLTQPDRPAGRGMKLQPSAVKQAAAEAGIPVAQPRGLRLDGRWGEDALSTRQILDEIRPDAMVVAAYGLILPTWVLESPRMGCLNIHASLLPRWRGAAPIHRAIEAGDALTGVTIMQMDAGLDTGPMLLTEAVRVSPAETTASLHDRLADLGARLIVEALELAACGGLRPVAQPGEGVTYAHKIDKAEAPLDWSLPALTLERRVRAFDPFPGATLRDGDEVIKVWSARAVDTVSHASAQDAATVAVAPTVAPGTVLGIGADGTGAADENQGVRVACGNGVLELMVLQRPSATRQPAPRVARGLGWTIGRRLR